MLISYKYLQAATAPNCSFNDLIVEVTKLDMVNVGTYTVTYTVEGTDNYDGDISDKVQITKVTKFFKSSIIIFRDIKSIF